MEQVPNNTLHALKTPATLRVALMDGTLKSLADISEQQSFSSMTTSQLATMKPTNADCSPQLPTADIVHAVWSDPTSPTGFGILPVRGLKHVYQLALDQEVKSLICAVVTVRDASAAIALAVSNTDG